MSASYEVAATGDYINDVAFLDTVVHTFYGT
jgi:hypothetical protein